MWWNYLYIPKLQRLHRCSLGMDKKFHLTLYNGCNYLSMLGLKLIHVSISGPGGYLTGLQYLCKYIPRMIHTVCALFSVSHRPLSPTLQIMIQATHLAQILYGGHYSRKKRGPRKISIWPPFSKMAAMGYPEMGFFVLEMAVNGQRRLLWQHSVCYWLANVVFFHDGPCMGSEVLLC